MRDIQSILVATDLSPEARHVMERAALLGGVMALSDGVAVHVLEKTVPNRLRQLLGASRDIEPKSAASASHTLAALAAEVERCTGFHLEPRVLVGGSLDAIVDVRDGIDLLVVGAGGRHRLRELALGSTAERLLRRTRQPVLVVKQKSCEPYRRVVVAVGFSPANVKAFMLARLAAPQADFHLVHACAAPFEGWMSYANVGEDVIDEYRAKAARAAQFKMTRFIGNAASGRANVFRHIEHGNPAAVLPKKARSLAADLMVVGKHAKSAAEEFFRSSVALQLLMQGECDTLVVQ